MARLYPVWFLDEIHVWTKSINWWVPFAKQRAPMFFLSKENAFDFFFWFLWLLWNVCSIVISFASGSWQCSMFAEVCGVRISWQCSVSTHNVQCSSCGNFQPKLPISWLFRNYKFGFKACTWKLMWNRRVPAPINAEQRSRDIVLVGPYKEYEAIDRIGWRPYISLGGTK